MTRWWPHPIISVTPLPNSELSVLGVQHLLTIILLNRVARKTGPPSARGCLEAFKVFQGEKTAEVALSAARFLIFLVSNHMIRAPFRELAAI